METYYRATVRDDTGAIQFTDNYASRREAIANTDFGITGWTVKVTKVTREWQFANSAGVANRLARY